jgi:hypothetical protein
VSPVGFVVSNAIGFPTISKFDRWRSPLPLPWLTLDSPPERVKEPVLPLKDGRWLEIAAHKKGTTKWWSLLFVLKL